MGARALAALAFVILPSLGAAPASAATLRVPALPGALQRAILGAATGDTILAESGIHRGDLRIDRRLTLRGLPGAVVQGSGNGSVLRVTAPGTRVSDLTLRGGGDRAMELDAGILLREAPGVRLLRLRIEDVLYGIAGERSDSLLIDGCALRGRASPLGGVQAGADASEGNGIHLWYCHDAVVRGSRVTRFVDGIYLSFTFRATIERNVLVENGRYGLHTMYNQQNRLLRNRFTHNVAGCALMFSNHLQVEENDFVRNRGARTYGLLLRDCSDGRFRHNRLIGNTIAIFMDGSNRNRVEENLLQDNGWGLLLFSSCDGNEFTGNTFWNDDYPVALDMRRSDNRFDDGSRGNYWSDNPSYDLDGDGVSDVPYSPVTAFAFLSKQFPDLAVFGKSPAAAALGMAERTLPALRPSEIVDRYPLATPVPTAPSRAAAPGEGDAGRPRGRGAATLGFGLLAAAGLAGAAGVTRAR